MPNQKPNKRMFNEISDTIICSQKLTIVDSIVSAAFLMDFSRFHTKLISKWLAQDDFTNARQPETEKETDTSQIGGNGDDDDEIRMQTLKSRHNKNMKIKNYCTECDYYQVPNTITTKLMARPNNETGEKKKNIKYTKWHRRLFIVSYWRNSRAERQQQPMAFEWKFD